MTSFFLLASFMICLFIHTTTILVRYSKSVMEIGNSLLLTVLLFVCMLEHSEHLLSSILEYYPILDRLFPRRTSLVQVISVSGLVQEFYSTLVLIFLLE